MKIAVVDDDPGFMQLMHDILKDRGWQILPCHDSLTAFSVLNHERPDTVVLDIRMETLQSGWDILTFLSLHPETADIPVIICTASDFELKEKADWLDAHGVTVMPKPFDIDDMYSALETALSRRQMGSEPAAAIG